MNKWVVWTVVLATLTGLATFWILPLLDIERGAPTDFILQGVGAADNPAIEGARNTSMPKRLLMINLASRVDLQTMAVRHKMFISETISPCVGGRVDSAQKLWSDMFPGDWLYDGIGAVDWWSRAPAGAAYRVAPSGPRGPDGRIRYTLFANATFAGHGRIREQVNYDLRRQPRDLCVEVTGSGNFGLEEILPHFIFFRSNTVVIPKRSVSEAIQKYDLQ